MDPHLEPVAFDDIRAAVCRHFAALPAAIDSFLEEQVLASAHYRIVVASEPAGFAAIHGGELITLFALANPYRRHAQPLFGQLRRLEQARSAFVPTGDAFFLAHALDGHRRLALQAYVFAEARDAPASLGGP